MPTTSRCGRRTVFFLFRSPESDAKNQAHTTSLPISSERRIKFTTGVQVGAFFSESIGSELRAAKRAYIRECSITFSFWNTQLRLRSRLSL